MKERRLKKIIEVLQIHLPELKKKFKVKRIGIFGSYAIGKETDKSDLDILVEFEKDAKITLFDLMRLENYIFKLTKIKVDLLTPDSISPYIKSYILEEVKFIEKTRSFS